MATFFAVPRYPLDHGQRLSKYSLACDRSRNDTKRDFFYLSAAIKIYPAIVAMLSSISEGSAVNRDIKRGKFGWK